MRILHTVLDSLKAVKLGKAAGIDGLFAKHSVCPHIGISLHLSLLFTSMLSHRHMPVGYEPAGLTVHPPPKLSRVGSFFSYRCLVFPKKCPQRKACTFLRYLG